MFFTFPEDARWNEERETVEFSVILGAYEGTVRVPRRLFQGLLARSPTPELCMEASHLQRTRFELIVERKLRRRQLTDDGNVEITGRDLRKRISSAAARLATGWRHNRRRGIPLRQPSSLLGHRIGRPPRGRSPTARRCNHGRHHA